MVCLSGAIGSGSHACSWNTNLPSCWKSPRGWCWPPHRIELIPSPSPSLSPFFVIHAQIFQCICFIKCTSMWSCRLSTRSNTSVDILYMWCVFSGHCNVFTQKPLIKTALYVDVMNTVPIATEGEAFGQQVMGSSDRLCFECVLQRGVYCV